jgi:hypothetical protein
MLAKSAALALPSYAHSLGPAYVVTTTSYELALRFILHRKVSRSPCVPVCGPRLLLSRMHRMTHALPAEYGCAFMAGLHTEIGCYP